MFLTYFFVAMIWSWWWLCYGCCYADCRAIYRSIESRRWWRRHCTKMRFDINSSRRILFFVTCFWHIFTNSESIRIHKSCSRNFSCFLLEQDIEFFYWDQKCCWNYLFTQKNGILLPKLFEPTVRKNCSSDREKLLNFEAEGREFEIFLRSIEQFIQTVKGQNNFW